MVRSTLLSSVLGRRRITGQSFDAYRQSVAALNAGKYAEAEKYAKQCMAIDPTSQLLAYESLAPALARAEILLVPFGDRPKTQAIR
jgi:hypothetical protein